MIAHDHDTRTPGLCPACAADLARRLRAHADALEAGTLLAIACDAVIQVEGDEAHVSSMAIGDLALLEDCVDELGEDEDDEPVQGIVH